MEEILSVITVKVQFQRHLKIYPIEQHIDQASQPSYNPSHEHPLT